ncbi:hypothetical protein CC78DRAFT_324149 [Lojkania enalia]|uniref:Uncharacterized protein n=1 Tax=Lojkania enalia TaxID=147567 RepID=A0A9P4K4T6_9PLEO|nr:hypothetical protein CC78DRAFT_324149 [Didymosphaeria enalia]
MDSTTSKEKDKSPSNKLSSGSCSTSPPPDPDLPRYYDSEPSSQPPSYLKPGSAPGQTRAQSSQPAFTGVSAASVRAVCAEPPTDWHEKRGKRSLKQRWKDWRESWSNHDALEYPPHESSTRWNAFGARIDGGGMTSLGSRPRSRSKSKGI